MAKGSGQAERDAMALVLDGEMPGQTSDQMTISLKQLMERYHAQQQQDGGSVCGVVLAQVQRSETRQMKSGRPYDIVRLSDATGQLEAKDFRRHIHQLDGVEYVRVELEVETYKGGPSAVVAKAEAIDPQDFDPNHFIPFDAEANQRHREQLRQVIESIAPSSPYRGLVEAALSEEAWEQFCTWPAAIRNHHAFKGGLLAHTLEVLHYAEKIAAIDDEPYDPNLLKAAVIFHDIGKLDEYAAPPKLERGLGGEFAYHLAHGQFRLGAAAERCRAAGKPIPPVALYRLMHCIEMSHGHHRLDQQRQFIGKEARVLAVADDYSVKLAADERERAVLARAAEAESEQEEALNPFPF